jgi:hypothetical protein
MVDNYELYILCIIQADTITYAADLRGNNNQ